MLLKSNKENTNIFVEQQIELTGLLMYVLKVINAFRVFKTNKRENISSMFIFPFEFHLNKRESVRQNLNNFHLSNVTYISLHIITFKVSYALKTHVEL